MAKFEAAIGRYVWLEIQGVEYRVYFEEAGHGIPLICQHTAGSDGKQWRHFLTDPDITSRFRVIVPDLPYHGKSLPPESQEWWAQEYRLTKSFFIDFHLALTVRALWTVKNRCSSAVRWADIWHPIWRWPVPMNSPR